MLLSEILEHLTYGELSQVDIGGSTLGGIQPADYPQLITFINLAMIEIYKRFPIKLGAINIQLYADILRYPLRYDYAVSNVGGAEPVKFILDSATDVFPADVLLIERITNLASEDIPINTLNKTDSVFTPEFDIISIAEPDATEIYTIDYKAYPFKLPLHNVEPTTTDITLPDMFLEAMLSYIGHRSSAALPTPEPLNSATFYTKFLAALNNVKELGLYNRMVTDNTKFETNGFA